MARRPRRWSEGEAVSELRKLFGAGAGATLVGIGDDAAVLQSPRAPLVATIDACVEGVHFDRRWLSLEDVGFRATQAAVSDLAAMGARPLAALANLCLPERFGKKELALVARGQAQALRSLGCPMVGGNLTRGPVLSIETVVLGNAEQPLLRDGARPGHELWLAGSVGLAGAGLACLQQRMSRGAAVLACVERWRRPQALLELGRKLAGRASACCDVSDGLARDALHLAEASRVRVVLEEEALERTLAPELVETARLLGRPPLDFALGGGEDYALVCAGPAERRPRFARRIGRIERGTAAVLEKPGGKRVTLTQGFDHLR